MSSASISKSHLALQEGKKKKKKKNLLLLPQIGPRKIRDHCLPKKKEKEERGKRGQGRAAQAILAASIGRASARSI